MGGWVQQKLLGLRAATAGCPQADPVQLVVECGIWMPMEARRLARCQKAVFIRVTSRDWEFGE